MKKTILFLTILTVITMFFIFSCTEIKSESSSNNNSAVSSDSGYQLTLNFTGPSVSPYTVYVCWVENTSETNLQNIYVCNSEVGIGKTLTGTPLPYWKTIKYKTISNIDGITGASVQGSAGFSVTRTLKLGTVKKFRVCFEIDRSNNSNTYFYDRPSFIYRSAEIDLDNLSSSAYNLSLYAWMSNDTTGTSYGQQPKVDGSITGWATYTLMYDLSYISDTSDMVTTLTAAVSAVK